MKDYLRFLEMMMVLVHITGGLPARGTELASIKYSNALNGQRDVYISKGLVYILTQYNKSEAVTERPKLIARFLPYRVSRLIIAWVADVLPFREALQVNSGIGVNQPRANYLFETEGEIWSTNKISTIMGQVFEAHFSHHITVSRWRHIAIAIDKRWLRSQMRNGLETQDYMANTLMAGHDREVEEHHYALSADLLVGLTHETLDAFHLVSLEWHKLFGLLPEPFSTKVGKGIDPHANNATTSLTQPSTGVRATKRRLVIEDDTPTSRSIVLLDHMLPLDRGNFIMPPLPMGHTALNLPTLPASAPQPLQYREPPPSPEELKAALHAIYSPSATFRDQ